MQPNHSGFKSKSSKAPGGEDSLVRRVPSTLMEHIKQSYELHNQSKGGPDFNTIDKSSQRGV